MSLAATAAVSCVIMVVLGIAATHPLELREHRWLKIILSLPLVVLVTSTFYELAPIRGYFAMWSIGLLAFIWKSPIAHFFSFSFVRLITGDWSRPTGIRAEFAGPKSLVKHGDYAEALESTLAELDKEPGSYEGLLLLAEIHVAMKRPHDAVSVMEKLLKKPGLTADQQTTVQMQKQYLEEQLLVLALNSK